MKITANQTFLHPMDLYPDFPDDRQGYTLRFEEGHSYDVPFSQAAYFVGHGWAEEAAEDAILSTPWNTRNATDESAAELERTVHAPARDAATVQTTRFIGTGTREVVGDGTVDVHEGENVRVVNLGLGESPAPADGTTLDVQNSTSGAGTNF